jgi:S1-C subfamily serine protease
MQIKSKRFKRLRLKPSLRLWVLSAVLLTTPIVANWGFQRFRSPKVPPTGPQFESAYKTVLQIGELSSGFAATLTGFSHYGITQLEYDNWRQRNGKPIEDLGNIELAEVRAIYQELWHQGNCKEFPAPLDVVCLDTALSFGVPQSQVFFLNLPSDPEQAALEIASRRELLRRQQLRPPVTPGKQLAANEGVKRDRALADWVVSDVAAAPTAPQNTAPQNTAPQNTAPQDTAPQAPTPSAPSAEAKPAAPLSADAIYQKLKPATVEILYSSQGGLAGTASGVLLTHNGLVLTNYHVVKNEDQLHVTLADGRKFTGTITAVDPDLDLALVQLSGVAYLPTVSLANDTTQVKVGDTVYAIGSPRGESWKMTTAQVIELNSTCANGDSPLRCIRTPGEFLQPGNSGGPLIDGLGQVVGINRAIQQSTGEGVSIPIETIRSFISEHVGELPKPLAPSAPASPQLGHGSVL